MDSKYKNAVYIKTVPATKPVTKTKLGQFYTTQYTYILQRMTIPVHVTKIIEPFAGKGHLIKFAQSIYLKQHHQFPKRKNITVEAYDIDPKPFDTNILINLRDTLANPPQYQHKFVITNPPYLAKNKTNSSNKSIFQKYKVNDLYKCFLVSIIKDPVIGGIIIVPLNFWCSIRHSDIQLRKAFLDQYQIVNLNVFEESVFDDTSYSVCCFQFETRTKSIDEPIMAVIYPSGKNIQFQMIPQNNYLIGGHIYQLPITDDIRVERYTNNTIDDKLANVTNILLKCIDDTKDSLIRLEMVSNEEREKRKDTKPKLSERSYAILVISPRLSLNQQQKLVDDFNYYLDQKRLKYHSLFLTNYRESSSIARKRISFQLAFRIINNRLQHNNYYL